MRAGSKLMVLAAVVCSFGDHSTAQINVEEDPMCITPPDSDQVLVTFDDMRERLENDESDMFSEGIELILGDDSPTLEDLKQIATDVKNGVVPDFVTDYGYSQVGNDSGTYDDSTNNGKFEMVAYGLLENLGTEGSYSMISIVLTQGKANGYAYRICSSLFGRVNYTKTDSSLNWQGSAAGVYLMAMPDDSLVPYGSHVAAAEGLALAHEGEAISSTEVLFIMNTTYYSSRTSGLCTSKIDSESYSGNFNMFSLTGGTNGTVSFSGDFSPDGNATRDEMRVVLRNAERESVIEHEHKPFYVNDKSNPLSDENLFLYFEDLFLGVNLYLP